MPLQVELTEAEKECLLLQRIATESQQDLTEDLAKITNT